MMMLRLWLLLLIMVNVEAAEVLTDEFKTKFERYHASYSLNSDATHTETITRALKVMKQEAVADSKQTSITYSAGIQKLEILHAFNRKPDGRKLDVPKVNFQLEMNEGKDKDRPVYSDLSTMTVVFPDVAVGDVLELSYKIVQLEAMFPGHFSMEESFSKIYAYDDVNIKVVYPVAMPVQYAVRQMQETISIQGNNKVLELGYKNPRPVKSLRQDYSVYDSESDPGYSFSTFKSYHDIAKAYGLRASPKAVVSQRIQKLADELAQGKQTEREQARVLYEWVSENISFAGHCIGVGAVVPHDIDFILDNRMGDCKDHATLLQAMLRAKNIDSTQALVNAGSSYELSRVPVASEVNHVINYIPALSMFVDSTATNTPFGMLPFQVSGKPVLLVDGDMVGIRTPVLKPGTNKQVMMSKLKINADGSVTGKIKVDLKGSYAVDSRAKFRRVNKDQEQDLVKHILRAAGLEGTGTLRRDDPKDLVDNYQYEADIRVENFVQMPGTGAFPVFPVFMNEAPVHRFLSSGLTPVEAVDVACSSGESEEEYEFHFPKGTKILSAPQNFSLKTDFLSYVATSSLKLGILRIRRHLVDKTPGNVCKPAVFEAYKKFASKVLQNVKAQVVYQ